MEPLFLPFFQRCFSEGVMASTQNHPVIATFATRGLAEAAVDALWHAGFEKNQIGLAGPGEQLHEATTATEPIEQAAENGAVRGAVAGSAIGALAGAVAAATIPGFGPVMAGGLLIGIAGGATGGAALGTFAGPFIAMGLSKERAHHYESEFRSGRTIVVVQAPDRHEEAVKILSSFEPLHVEAAGTPVPASS
jgi:hypothetical protein